MVRVFFLPRSFIHFFYCIVNQTKINVLLLYVLQDYFFVCYRFVGMVRARMNRQTREIFLNIIDAKNERKGTIS